MTEDQTPALEAGDEAVREEQTSASEATENTDDEGQVKDPPADPDNPEGGEGEESVSPSKARRERRKAEMERLRNEAEEAKRERDQLTERRQKIEQAAQASQPPKESDFADYNDFLMASGAYHAQKAWDDRQTRDVDEQISAHDERIKQAEQQRQQEVAQEWAAQVDEAKARYADFEQVAFSAPISDDVAQMVAASDQGADLAYYLGSNVQEAERISKLPPLEAARAIGTIEARLSLPKPKTTTETPDPIDPVKPKASASKDPAKMSNAEYRKWRGLSRS